MPRLAQLCLIALIPACASAPPPCVEEAAPSVVVASPPAPPPASSPVVIVTHQESLCFSRGAPKARAQKHDASPFCDGLDPKELAKVESRLKKELVPDYKPSKLVIDFGCDEAYGEMKDVILEDGSGHGGTLRIARFAREGETYRVRVIDSSHYYDAKTVVLAGRIEAARLDKLLASSRVAMLARPHFVRLHDPKDAFGSMSASFSSNDFHLRLTLIDEAGRATDQGFTGYESSDEQPRIVPMQMATEPLFKLLEGVKLSEEPATDDDRAFFSERLLATFDGDPYWWVKERYLKLAAQLGTVDALPSLAQVAAAPVTKVGGSEERARQQALAAIASLSGWDPRVDDRGKEVDPAAAGAAAARECLSGS